MDCRKFHRNLEDYLEGGLDFTGRFGMERHAQQCFGCGKTVADAQKLSQMVRESGRVGAPADFEAAVLTRIRKEGLAQPSWKFWRLPAYFLEWPSLRSVAMGASALALVGFAALITARWVRMDRSNSSVSAAHESVASPPLQRKAAALPVPAAFNPPQNAAASRSARMLTPVRVPVGERRAGYSIEENSAGIYLESSDSDYVECLVPGPGNRQYIMRLPKTIRMRYGQPSEEYFIRNVSH